MATSTLLAAIFVLCSVLNAEIPQQGTDTQATPEHQILAIYFHRTARCPTCKRIGALAESTIQNGFAKEIKQHMVGFQLLDFQNEKNSDIVKEYGIESPTLLILNIYNGETVCWMPMPRVWQLVGDPDVFREYVHEGIVHYLNQSLEDAREERKMVKEVQP